MNDPKLYRIVRPVLAFFFRLIYRPTTVGAENIPKEGKIVLAGNHTHLLNCFSVGFSTKRCVRFIAKAELMKGIGKYIFPGLGIIPLDRSTNGKEAISAAEKCLEEGNVVAIFPEGTVNRTDKPMMPFKGGAVKIAADTGCDIVPFAITGQYKPFKKGLKITFLPKITVEKGSLKATNKLLEETVLNVITKEGN